MPRRSGASSPPKDDIPDAVPEADAATLELGQRPVCRSRGEAAGSVLEHGLGSERSQDLRSIVLPVGRRMQKAARNKPEGKLAHEGRLQQAAFVMPLLRPGVGKEDVDACER